MGEEKNFTLLSDCGIMVAAPYKTLADLYDDSFSLSLDI
jgi:hypothetical protein